MTKDQAARLESCRVAAIYCRHFEKARTFMLISGDTPTGVRCVFTPSGALDTAGVEAERAQDAPQITRRGKSSDCLLAAV
jgi:hypothetical protein